MSGGKIAKDKSPDVLIIGGGVAGLAAAVDLTSRGHSILLVEQKQRLGGRTYSFIHPETGDEVDNGQHLLRALLLFDVFAGEEISRFESL